MKYTVKIFFLLLLFPAFVFSQMPNVKPEDVRYVNDLKEKYTDAKVVAVKSSEEYTFDLNSHSEASPVAAFLTENDQFISLKDNYSMPNVIFYNSQSKIDKLKAKGSRGRPVNVFPEMKKYEDDGIFCDDVELLLYNLDFDTRGERIEQSYQKLYFDVKYLTSTFFHEAYPVEEKVITFVVPDWLEVELKEMNFDGYNIQKKTSANPKDKTTTYTYTAHNLQARKREHNAPNMAKNYPHILILSKSYTMKDGHKKNLFGSVKDLYGWYASLAKEVDNKDETLKPVVERLIKDKKTDIDKVEAIFYWVQENIRYIAFEDGIMGFKPESAQNVFKNKYGDCKGKANLTKEMLKIAGFDARLTWIGTNDIPYDYSVPSLAVDNHMICTLILDGKKYFLDATETYIAFNDYANRIQGRQVLIEDGSDKYMLDRVPEFGIDRNKVETTCKLTLDDDVLKGVLRNVYNGEEKTTILRGYSSIRSDNKEDALKKYLTGGDKNLKLTGVVTTDLENRENPLEVTYNLEIDNYVTRVGSEVYLNIDKDKEFGSFDFDSTRVNDYEFSHKILIISHEELTVPSGYKTDHLPEAVNLTNPDFSFKLTYSQTGNKILYEKRITIDNAIIHKKDFDTWNKYVKAIKQSYNDQIVLVKS